jgi:hypothetical protein
MVRGTARSDLDQLAFLFRDQLTDAAAIEDA